MDDEGSSGIPSVPKAPFIIGDVLITGIAAAVLFQDFQNLGPTTLLACVFAMVAGAALLVFPYALDYKTLRLLARLEANQVGLNVADALERAEAVLKRLEELERKRDASSILTDKLPELIRERLDKFVSETASQSERTFSQLAEGAGPKLANQVLPHLKTVQKDLTALSEKSLLAIEAIESRIETTLQPLNTITKRLESNLAALQIASPTIPEVPPSQTPDKPSNSPSPQPQSGKAHRPQPDAVPESRKPPALGTSVPSEPEPITQPPLSPKSESKENGPLDTERPSKAPPPGRPKNTRLRVTAFVGIANKIHLRGTGGGLDPDTGITLQMTGIGEWEWSEKLSETVSCGIWLNDTTPATENPITLNPGDNLTIQPTFD